MRKYLLAAALVALALPALAAAKGPVSASVSGPTLDGALTIRGDGEGPGTALGTLAIHAVPGPEDRRVAADSVFFLASVTKPIVATAGTTAASAWSAISACSAARLRPSAYSPAGTRGR